MLQRQYKEINYSNMEPFPKLEIGQVALMRAENQTGHVLDEQFLLATKDEQKVYTVFNSAEEALINAKSIVFLEKKIEYIVYDRNQKVLYYITP
jgi:hypothetical protein